MRARGRIYQRFPAMYRKLLEHTRQFQPAPDQTRPKTSSGGASAGAASSAKAMAESFKQARNRYAE